LNHTPILQSFSIINGDPDMIFLDPDVEEE